MLAESQSYLSGPATEATAEKEDLPLRLAPTRAQKQDLLLRSDQPRTHPPHLEAKRSLPPHCGPWRY